MSAPALLLPLADRARRDLAALALLAGAFVSGALADLSAGLPQVLAALAVLALGARAERLDLPLPGRLAALLACGAWAWLPGGAPPAVLGRFTAAIAAVSLVKPKVPREQGFLFLVVLVQTGLAAAIETRAAAAPGAVLLALLGHRALGSWHRWKSAARVASKGGPLVLAGAPRGFSRAADVAAFASLAIAVPLFVVLPRTDLPLLSLPGIARASEPGVGDEVRLGRLGPLSDRDEVVGRAQPLDEAARALDPYFRAAALEDFDGRRWSTSSRDERRASEYDGISGHVQMPHVYAKPGSPRFLLVFEATASTRLPLPERTADVVFRDPVPRAMLRDSAGCLRPETEASVPRFVYEATVGVPAKPRGAPPPAPATSAAPPEGLRKDLSPEVGRVLEGIPRGAARRRAEALTSWIRSTCRYSLTGAPDGPDPVGDFLLRSRRGHCEYFASALAVCLRLAGIPSRLVAGYHASRWNETGEFYVVRRRDAHAWVEAWLPDEGWARFDATPPAALEPDPYAGTLGFLARWLDAGSFAWNRNVIGYDPAAQREVLSSVRETLVGLLGVVPPGEALVGTGALALLVGLPWWLRRRRRHDRGRRDGVAGSTVAFYRRALDLLARRGVVRRADETSAELAARAAKGLPPPAARALADLTAAFEAVRYGASPPPKTAGDWLRALAR